MNTLQKTVRKCRVLSGVMASYKNPIVPLLDHLRLLPRKEKIISLRNGLRFKARTHTSDLPVVNEMFVHGAYDPILDQIEATREMTGIDIGAHIGTFTTLAAVRFPGIRFYSFEPFPDNFRLLRENIHLNGLDKRVVPIQKAVSGKQGTAELFVSEDDTGGGSLYAAGPESRVLAPCMVETLTLKDIFESFSITRVDVMKVDCEGGEYELFYSTPPEYLRRISRMIVEYHTHTHANWRDEKARLKAFFVRPRIRSAGA